LEANMNEQCDGCGYEPADYPVSERQTLIECGECGRTFCEDCLQLMAAMEGLNDYSPSMLCHPETGDTWCPECWQQG